MKPLYSSCRLNPKEQGQGARIGKYGYSLPHKSSDVIGYSLLHKSGDYIGYSLLHKSTDYIAVHALHGVSGTLLYEFLQCDRFVLPQVAQKEICMHGM
jgi:hypothetical protein